MVNEGAVNQEHNDPYKHGTAAELIEDVQTILDIDSAGDGFLKIAPETKRLVEVKFVPADDIGYQIGFVEKWNNSILSVMVNNGSSDKPNWKHHRLEKKHNIGWKLINLNKE